MKSKSIAQTAPQKQGEEPLLRYVLYARKSSEDVGAQAKSLPDQIKDCMKYAEDNGLYVVETLKESHSAKLSGKRPVFSKMLKDLEAGKYDGILSWHPDRLARNSLEAGMIVDMVDNDIIKDLKFPTLAFNNDSGSKLLLNIMFAMSKQYSEHLSESVQRGVDSNIAQGKSGGTPKWGYNRSEVTGLYEPDENFQHIRHCFDMYLDGHSQKDIVEYLRRNDVHRMTKITRKNKVVRKIAAYNSTMVIANILGDPFYYGMLVQGGQSVNLCEIIPNFKPILTEDEFGRVQSLRRSLQKTVSASVKAKDDLTFIPFRKFVRCAVCGNFMHIQRSVSSNKVDKFLYFRCGNKDCTRKKKNIRGRVVLEQIYDAIEKLNFQKKSTVEELRNDLTDYIKHRHNELLTEKLRLNAQIKVKQRNLEELSQNYLDLDKNAPEEARDLLNRQIEECRSDIASLQADRDAVVARIFDPELAQELLNETTNKLSDLGFKIRNANSWEKDQLARKLLTNIELSDDETLIYRYKSPIPELLEIKKHDEVMFGAPD